MIRLRMDTRRDVLQHERDLVSPDHRPKVPALPVAALMVHVKAQGLVELEGFSQIIHDEERSNAVQHALGSP